MYQDIDYSYIAFLNIMEKHSNGLNYFFDNAIVEDLHREIYRYNELVHLNVENDLSSKYKTEMFRNTFESLKLCIVTRKTSALHVLRSVLELYSKMNISRMNFDVDRKFSVNIDKFIKEKKHGRKKDARILIELKDELKGIYYDLCEYVHTGETIDIEPFQVMEDVFQERFAQDNFEYVVKKMTMIIKYFIKIDLLANSQFYFSKLPSTVLSDYKNIYLNDIEKGYFYNSTENKKTPTN